MLVDRRPAVHKQRVEPEEQLDHMLVDRRPAVHKQRVEPEEQLDHMLVDRRPAVHKQVVRIHFHYGQLRPHRFEHESAPS